MTRVIRAEGVGGEQPSIKLLDLWHLLFPEGSADASFEGGDVAQWLDIYTNDCERYAVKVARQVGELHREHEAAIARAEPAPPFGSQVEDFIGLSEDEVLQAIKQRAAEGAAQGKVDYEAIAEQIAVLYVSEVVHQRNDWINAWSVVRKEIPKLLTDALTTRPAGASLSPLTDEEIQAGYDHEIKQQAVGAAGEEELRARLDEAKLWRDALYTLERHDSHRWIDKRVVELEAALSKLAGAAPVAGQPTSFSRSKDDEKESTR